jgi:hypothetical protein
MPARACVNCNKSFSSKQRYDYHIEHKVCLKAAITKPVVGPSLKPTVAVPPSVFVGFDINNSQYYRSIADEQKVKIDIVGELSVTKLIKLFTDLNHLGDPKYGHPIKELVKSNEQVGGLAAMATNRKYNVYSYYNEDGKLVENSDDIDLIRRIYDQLVCCFLLKANSELVAHQSNFASEIKFEEIDDMVSARTDNKIATIAGRKVLKEELDKHFGEGTFDKNWDKKANYYDNKKRMRELYKKIIMKNYPKYEVDTQMTFEDILKMSKGIHDFMASEMSYETFRSTFKQLSQLQ